VKIKLNSR